MASADSPALQAAWIYEKLHAWSDNPGDVERILSMDEMLDNIMLYWLPNAGASSGRLYWEVGSDNTALPIELPVGVSQFTAAPDIATSYTGTNRTEVVTSQRLSSRISLSRKFALAFGKCAYKIKQG